MKFNLKKYTAFTVGELMILLAVLTVLLAAFAPVFTVRYNNATAEDVWSYVADSEDLDAYSDQISKAMTSQFFIGISPAGSSDVLKAIKDSSNNSRYSKLVIRATDVLSGSEKLQKQIQFRYGSSKKGDPVGAIFAGNNNILFGGDYKNITNSAVDNSSFGRGSLDKITSGVRNTALGYYTLSALTTSKDITAIGYNNGDNVSTGHEKNTLIGDNIKVSSNSNNTIIGHSIIGTKTVGDNNTIILPVLTSPSVGRGNVIIGYNASSTRIGNNIGNYNTAVGAYSLGYGTSASSTGEAVGSYNTAVGSYACSGVTGSNKTCIGAGSGIGYSSSISTLLSDDKERIFIGGQPGYYYSDTLSRLRWFDYSFPPHGAAVLEVHTDSKNIKNNSVLVNGNLVVRGQSFLRVPYTVYDGKIDRFGTTDKLSEAANIFRQPALIGFKIDRAKAFSENDILHGVDPTHDDVKTQETCGRNCRGHREERGREACICTFDLRSYDWATTSKESNISAFDCMGEDKTVQNGKGYKDQSTNTTFNNPSQYFINYAHPYQGHSCCPMLQSDIRLKELTGVFNGGLADIKRINVYNYTYKSDKDKLPHVGIIAQDLKRIFPTAVTKDKNGYYQIRWDEMLYAAINAVKALNSKVENLASKIANDQNRIAALKKDNAQLEKRLDNLTNELTVLETQRNK
ncbi:hypothetical protein HDR58_03410 [bacterium]|nr:hypothetical protein [bacterium]